MNNKKLCALIIMDGFGIPTDVNKSAIKEYNTQNLQKLASIYPTASLEASEGAVGLPDGQMGTSEVGHLTMGAGRVKNQSMVEINKAISSGEFFKNETLIRAMETCKKNNSSLHLIGIPTDGGIHSHIDHLISLVKMASVNGLTKVYVHFLGDGRDTPSKSALTYLSKLENAFYEYGVGKVATVIGRFYALDRDNNWDRVEKAYNAMVKSEGLYFSSAKEAIESAYIKGETDEFISPSIITENGKPVGEIKTGDVIISYNYRTDRAKQLVKVFDKRFDKDFVLNGLDVKVVTMTSYDDAYTFDIAFPPKNMINILGAWLEKLGLKQARIAETEKYAHVTFFFNDGKVEPFRNEDRVLVASEKMKSYALKPEMSAKEVCDKAIEKVKSGEYDVIVVNFANCDMVGHSGDMGATEKAVLVVDQQVNRLIEEIKKVGGDAIITADHGNADCMILEDGSPCTSHTTNLVPIILVSEKLKNVKLKECGSLADIAPTILTILDKEIPTEMTGKSLIIK